MTRRRTVIASLAFTAAAITGAVLGTAMGSAEGPFDDWGCPSERIATETFTPAEGGGYSSVEDALAAMVVFLAADGDETRAEYAEAIASRSGPTRYEPDSGRILIDDQVEAQIRFEELGDGTWTPSQLTLCGRPVPPELASPYPTPVGDAGS